jgi:hypothetical protein
MTGAEDIPYRGCVLRVEPHGSGWRAFIHNLPKGVGLAPAIPSTMEYEDRNVCIADAKGIADDLLSISS